MEENQANYIAVKVAKEKIFTNSFLKIMIADLTIKITFSMLNVLIPIYMLDQGYSTAIAGLVTTIYLLSAAVFRPISGILVDKKGRFLIITIGSVVYSLAAGLYLFSIPFWVLILIQVLQGFGFAFNGTALRTLATDNIPESRMSEGLGYLGLTQTLSSSISPLIILAVRNAFGYHVAFIVVLSFTALILLSRFWLKPSKEQAQADRLGLQNELKISIKSDQKPFFLWKLIDKEACKPSLIMMVMMFTNSTLMTFLVAYSSEKGIENAGIFFTASAIMTAVARLLVGKVHEKFGSVGVIAPGIFFFIISLIIVFSELSIPTLALAGALSGLSIGVILPQVNSLAVLNSNKENRGLANSTLFLEMDIGFALGAVIWGSIANVTGLRYIYIIAAAVSFTMLVLYFILRRSDFFGEKKAA